MGYCGQYSFAQGAFYGIGAYTAAILHRDLGLDFWQTLPLGVLSAGVFGLLLGIPSLRLSGHFLSITTIAFQTIIYLLLTQWKSFTGGQYTACRCRKSVRFPFLGTSCSVSRRCARSISLPSP